MDGDTRTVTVSEAVAELEIQHRERQFLWDQSERLTSAIQAVNDAFNAAAEAQRVGLCVTTDQERHWYIEMKKAMDALSDAARARHNALGKTLDAHLVNAIVALTELYAQGAERQP